MMSGWSRRVASIAALLVWACGSLCASAETAMPRVRVARPAEGGAVLALDAALASYEWIQLVPASAPASLTIDVATEGLRIRGADGVVAAPAIAVAAPDAGRRLAEAVVRAAGVVLTSTEAAMYEVMFKAGTPEFKQALPLIK